jgi:4-hydroxy-tetrahydrodipicolinate synthase
MAEINGIICPIITPMNGDESVNEKELRNQVNRLISAGIHGIFAFGTNGEAYILSESEKEFVLSVIVDEVKGRVPVYAGTGCAGTGDTIRLSKKAKAIGADVLSIVTPYFAQASQEELYAHYEAVAGEVDLPIILYNIPARAGNALAPATVEKLSAVENIVGVKDSSGNFDNMLQYIERTRGKDFAVLSGNDSLILWNLLAGGVGGVAGCANVFPENIVGIYNSFVRGDLASARAYQDNIRTFRSCFRFGNSIAVIKAAVETLGYPVGKCRRPFCMLSDEGIRAIGTVLEENKKLGIK